MISLLFIAVLVIALGAGLLYFFQHKMIYHPRPYHEDYARLIPTGGTEVNYTTSCGKQTAFYVPPAARASETTAPERLWIMFGGNASLALFWSETVNQMRDEHTGFLLVDYPGYGKCEGSATPASIDESADRAMQSLAETIGTDTSYRGNINVVGHSLGSGVATSFATRHPVRRMVLVAPYTSLRAVARQVVGRFPATLLRHHYDNDQTLAELASREKPPRVFIIHGTNDNIIPVSMARELKRQFPEMVEYLEIPGGDHIDVLDFVHDYMNDAPPPKN